MPQTSTIPERKLLQICMNQLPFRLGRRAGGYGGVQFVLSGGGRNLTCSMDSLS